MMNSDYYNDESAYQHYELLPKEPLPLSIFLLLPFLVATVAVSAMPGWNYAVIGLGALCAAVFLLASLRDGFFVPTELKLFMAFFVWSIFGLFVARVPELVTERLRTMLQLVIMAMIVSYYARNARCVSWIFMAVLTGVLIITVAAVITGEYNRAEVEGEEARLVGLVMNANAFAIATTYGIAIALFLFRQVRSLVIKGVIIVCVLAGSRFVIASGSRKGFLALGILIFFWFLLTYGKELRTRPALTLAMGVGVVLMGAYMMYHLRDTTMMRRFLLLKAEAGLEGEVSEGVRVKMIKEGIRMTVSNPVLGVGLNNFRVHFAAQKASHNNYVDISSTTGIPGAILYFMIYVLIIRRIYQLRHVALAPPQRDLVTTLLCLMILVLFLDIGVVSYYTKITWIFLAIMIGFLNALHRDLENASTAYPGTDYAYEVPVAGEY